MATYEPASSDSADDETAAALKTFCKGCMAPYKYPRWFEWRESLPRNDRGKVARKELKAELKLAREERSGDFFWVVGQ